ncbi:MAG TPA: tetratricopeptide repeat protein [Polyangia bacterium]|nr:tetratricopeptide repeat protein [Polyangia bacterium]
MFRFLFALGAVLSLGSGCDSLHARMLAQEAVNLYHKGQLNEAAEKFAEAGKLDPYIPAIQLDLGFANLAVYQAQPKTPTGDQAASTAVAAFERYLQLRPDEERAKVFLVQTFVDTGRYDEAVAFFKPQVEKNPPDGEALGTLGIIAAKTGRYEDAKGWYEKRVAAEPQNADARLALGVLMWDYLHSHTDVVGPDRVALSDVAIQHLAEAIKIRPKAPNAYLYTNLVYRERAAGETDDDHKRVDLEEANKFFRIANEMTKGSK